MSILNRLVGLCVVVIVLVSLTGCGSLFKGDKGDAGEPGVSLIATYTGTISVDGTKDVPIPEILNAEDATFVKAYWTIGTATNWYVMADGFDAAEHACIVSWSGGFVRLTNMWAGDRYLIKVYQNN